jgi:hypothetical protein
MLSSLLIQILNGLASASLLFLVGLGLTLIFGVTRIVNFAHGSFYMLGLYISLTLNQKLGLGVFGFWGGALLAALTVAAFGVLIEILILRRIYAAPELLQLITNFVPLGPRRYLGTPCTRLCWRRPGFRPTTANLRSFANRARPSDVARSLATIDAHPLGHAAARGDTGS